MTADAVQVLLQSVDVMREMTQSAQAKQPILTVGADALSGELARILAQKSPPGAAAAPPVAAPAAVAAPATAAAATVHAAAAAVPVPAAAAAVPNVPAAAVDLADIDGWRIEFEPDPSMFETCNDPPRIFGELATLELRFRVSVPNRPRAGERAEPPGCQSGGRARERR